MNSDKAIYYGLLVLVVVIGLVLEFTHVIEGILPAEGMVAIYAEYIMVMLTLGSVYLMLRLYKKNATVRACVLALMMVVDLVCYYVFSLKASFFWLALIALAGYPFVFPSEVKEGKEVKEGGEG